MCEIVTVKYILWCKKIDQTQTGLIAQYWKACMEAFKIYKAREGDSHVL